MKAKELRAQNPAQLTQKVLELKREQFNLRMQAAAGQNKLTHQFKVARRDVARLKTVLAEKAKAGEA